MPSGRQCRAAAPVSPAHSAVAAPCSAVAQCPLFALRGELLIRPSRSDLHSDFQGRGPSHSLCCRDVRRRKNRTMISDGNVQTPCVRAPPYPHPPKQLAPRGWETSRYHCESADPPQSAYGYRNPTSTEAHHPCTLTKCCIRYVFCFPLSVSGVFLVSKHMK